VPSPDGIGHQGTWIRKGYDRETDTTETKGSCIPWAKTATPPKGVNSLRWRKKRENSASLDNVGNVRCEQHVVNGTLRYRGACDGSNCTVGSQHCPERKWDGDKKPSRPGYCDEVIPQVCSKRVVYHANFQSTSAGVLIFKRSSCFLKHGMRKCSVFKVPSCPPQATTVLPPD